MPVEESEAPTEIGEFLVTPGGRCVYVDDGYDPMDAFSEVNMMHIVCVCVCDVAASLLAAI